MKFRLFLVLPYPELAKDFVATQPPLRVDTCRT